MVKKDVICIKLLQMLQTTYELDSGVLQYMYRSHRNVKKL